MDIELLKSAPEDQMEMMMMMMTMQMDKLPDLYGTYTDISQTPPVDFTPPPPPQLIDDPRGGSPAFVNPPSTISFTGSPPVHETKNGSELPGGIGFPTPSQKRNSMAAMREMIFRMAAMQPIHIDPESVKPPKRRNVKISKDPQSVAARHRRERISERIRILQRIVPGGTKMDTASMLDEAIHYVKFLKNQVQSLERAATNRPTGIGFPVPMSSGNYIPMGTQSYQSSSQHYLDA